MSAKPSKRTRKRKACVEHPMQPIMFDRKGVARFKKNKIVALLVDARPQCLNELALMNFPREDHEQLAQLIGYSVSGAGDLSYFSRKRIATADRIVESMAKIRELRPRAKARKP